MLDQRCDVMIQRHLVHSFPRPKPGETESSTLRRALAILALIRKIGLVLAPEVLDWDLRSIAAGSEKLQLLQRRLCLTEISPPELWQHSTVFGPIALAFDIEKMRGAGAMPAFYVPQGAMNNALSQIGTYCVLGAHHTKYVLERLQELKNFSDPDFAAGHFQKPVDPNYNLTLRNSDSAGNIVATSDVPARQVQSVLKHVGFNNIPFDHSIGILSIFLNMFCPTDNTHTGEHLGYYRQREWRVIAGDVRFNNRPLGRPLLDNEKAELLAIDRLFWERALTYSDHQNRRCDLALVYEPVIGWNAFEFVEAIYAPGHTLEQVREVVGDDIPIYSLPKG